MQRICGYSENGKIFSNFGYKKNFNLFRKVEIQYGLCGVFVLINHMFGFEIDFYHRFMQFMISLSKYKGFCSHLRFCFPKKFFINFTVIKTFVGLRLAIPFIEFDIYFSDYRCEDYDDHNDVYWYLNEFKKLYPDNLYPNNFKEFFDDFWEKKYVPPKDEVFKEYYSSKFIRIFNEDYLNSPYSFEFEICLPFLKCLSVAFKKPWSTIGSEGHNMGWKYLGFYLGQIDNPKRINFTFCLFKWQISLEFGNNSVMSKGNDRNLNSIKRFIDVSGNNLIPTIDQARLIDKYFNDDEIIDYLMTQQINIGAFILWLNYQANVLNDGVKISNHFVDILLDFVKRHTISTYMWVNLENNLYPKLTIEKKNEFIKEYQKQELEIQQFNCQQLLAKNKKFRRK